MKKFNILFLISLFACSVFSQVLKITESGADYFFPASQTEQMTYSNGTSLTVMSKTFTLSNVSDMAVIDVTTVSSAEAPDNTINIIYNATSATVNVAENISEYVTVAVSGAHVSIAQSDSLVSEITYNLSGTSEDGEFYMSGKYKATLELNNLTLANTNPVYSGAAVHVQNGKRINVKVLTGTTNTLTDASSGSQKGCLYIKGHAEFKQSGTLNVYGNKKHGIKTGEYISVKNATINVLKAKGDGINCEQYFLMESGAITITGTTDDGIQCDIEETSTGETTEHEDEDSGNMYFEDGSVSITVEGIAAKGIKAEGSITINGGTINVTTTGDGEWDDADLETNAACGISSDANITITSGTIALNSSGSGGKGLKCDSMLTISGDAVINITTTGGLYYNDGTNENTNYTGNTDNVNSDYYSAAKGIKAGTKTETSSQLGRSEYTYAGGIVISGGTIKVTTAGHNAEGIESKSTMVISGGEIFVDAYDDALNAGSDLTIEGGYVYARSASNDAIDANGNCYIQGGLVFAIGSAGGEMAVDANSEDQKKLYVSGGTLVALGGLERGASLTQACYSVNSWSSNTWYALTVGSNVFAFLSPASGGTQLIVSGASTPTLQSGVTASGTAIFDGKGYYPATVSGGSSVELSSYTGGQSGPGGGPGGRP